MLSEFLREQRELLWQPNLDKKMQNCTYFSSVQDEDTFYVCDRVIGMPNSNILPKSVRSNGVAMATKVSKNKPKLQ